MSNEVDISETSILLTYGEEIVRNMLKDHTTSSKHEDGTEDTRNIYWATDSYAFRGDGYGFFDAITIDKITGNDTVVRPRSVKSREEQTQRVKDKAEVFTPSWICNAQNNLIDEAWFGRTDVFNRPDPDDEHGWIDTEEKIAFSMAEGKNLDGITRKWIVDMESQYNNIHGNLIPIESQEPRTLTHWRVLTIECGGKKLNIYPDGGFINGWTILSKSKSLSSKFYTNANTDTSDIIDLRRVQDVKFDVDVEG